jgi:hypothetical protein
MATARLTDPETSHEAASGVTDVTRTQARIVALLKAYGPLTDGELFDRYLARVRIDDWKFQTEQSIRSRRSELVKQERVRFSGRFGQSPTGRRARVWELA